MIEADAPSTAESEGQVVAEPEPARATGAPDPDGAAAGESAESAPPPPLGQPSGNPILTVSGRIGNANAADAEGRPLARFDLRMLERLGLTVIETTTNWTEGVGRFEGVLFSDLLDAVDADGPVVRAVAINDYAVDLEVDELRRYPVLLAFRLDGELMRVRDKGPIWVIYPRDDYPELMDEANNIKWIWQLDRIAVTDGQASDVARPQ